MPTTPDIPDLAGGELIMPAQAPAAGQPCLSTEESYLAISQATAGADINAISAALTEVENDPTGINSSDEASLANRLRIALGLSPSLPPCETVLAALHDSAQLAQIASAAGDQGPPTGGVGQPPPISPTRNWVPPGAPGGARGHGYCPSVSTGCQG